MSETWRTRLGIVLILVGVAGIIVGFGPLQFADRLSSRVEAQGTVQWGLEVDATSADDTVGDGQYGAWKVDYEIDGSGHTGVILGEYHAGQLLTISAPPDGSVYAILREGTTTGLKVLSWFLLPLSLAVIGMGGWWLAAGLRAQDVRNREIARQQLARMHPHLFPLEATARPAGTASGVGPYPNGSGSPTPPAGAYLTIPQPTAEPERRDPKLDFFKPYDI